MENWFEEYGIKKPFYSDNAVCIVHGDCKERIMDNIIIPVIYVQPPIEVINAVKNADKPRITIIKGR